jgi:hypothetical protein
MSFICDWFALNCTCHFWFCSSIWKLRHCYTRHILVWVVLCKLMIVVILTTPTISFNPTRLWCPQCQSLLLVVESGVAAFLFSSFHNGDELKYDILECSRRFQCGSCGGSKLTFCTFGMNSKDVLKSSLQILTGIMCDNQNLLLLANELKYDILECSCRF